MNNRERATVVVGYKKEEQNASYSMKSNEYACEISTRLVASVSNCIRLCTVLCSRVPRNARLQRGTKKRNQILCPTTKIVCRNVFYDTASIRRWSRVRLLLLLLLLHVHGGHGLKTVESRWATTNEVGKAFNGPVHDANVACEQSHLSSLPDRSRRTRGTFSRRCSRTLLLHDTGSTRPTRLPADYFLFPKLELKTKRHFFNDIAAKSVQLGKGSA